MVKSFEFKVGDKETHEVRIELKTFWGFEFLVFINGNLHRKSVKSSYSIPSLGFEVGDSEKHFVFIQPIAQGFDIFIDNRFYKTINF